MFALPAAGCGNERSVRVVQPTTVQPQDLARYPAGSPQRSTLELLRAAQLNDPAAVAGYLAPAFGLDRAAVARSLDGLHNVAISLRVPRRLTLRGRDGSAALVSTPLPKDRLTLRWTRAGTGWRLTGIGVRSGKLARVITSAIFLARHPELNSRVALRDRRLLHEWYALWLGIRALGR